MKKAMIITVGVGGGVENAIAYSIKQHNPSLIAFCFSPDSDKTYKLVRSSISGVDEENIMPFENPEINNFEKLHLYYCKCIRDIESRGIPKDCITADYTSGTKAMSAALVTAAITEKIDSISYVYGERDPKDGGRTKSGTEIIYSLRPVQIYSDQNIQLAKQFFNIHQYEAAISIISNNIWHPSKKEESAWILTLAKMYDAWDKFNFDEAILQQRQLNAAVSEKYNTKKITDCYGADLRKLKQQVEIYNRANEQKATREEIKMMDFSLTADLLNNAFRRSVEGKYDDAVARLYRALESIAQVEYVRLTNLATNLALNATMELLKENNNNTGIQYVNNKPAWEKLLSMRNNSILAHGYNPVKKEQFEKFYKAVKELMPGYKQTEWLKI